MKTSKLRNLLTDVRLYWNEAPKGRYMPFKEIIAYAGGGIGVKFLSVMALNVILSTTNVLIGNTIGIRPTDMYILYVISVLVNIPLSGVRANIIDNTRGKDGKYKPYIVKAGIPSALLTIAFVWFPYDQMEALFGSGDLFGRSKGYIATCVIVLLFNFAQNFFYYFFYESYDNLLHVLSPNSQERTDVASIKGVVYSIAPSIMGLVMPLFAQWFTNNNMYDIRLYRYVYPPLCILGIVLCIVIYVNTKEKIVQAKTHVIQIKFMDSLREVVRNKYFWVIALAGWLGFLESAVTTMLQYLYNYGGVCSGTEYTLITLFCQSAGFVGMVASPFCIRKWGKRGVLIMTNVFNVVFIALMFPFINSLLILVICFYMNALMNAFAQILTPTIQADIRDYQQYVTGERIDGMFSTITALGGIVTLVTSGVLPALYERFGINETVARQVLNDTSVMNRIMDNGSRVGDVVNQAIANGSADISYFSLYDPDILTSMVRMLIVVSVIGAIVNVIPYFFYDLTELKQQGIIKVLKIRAFFEDFGNNTLSDSSLVEVVEMVEAAEKLKDETPAKLSKDGIKAAKASKDKARIKQAKADYRAAADRNAQIKMAPFVLREMDRFGRELGKVQIDCARKIVDGGLEGLGSTTIGELKAELRKAKKLPHSTEDEKELRKYLIDFNRKRLTARKYQRKYYDGKAELTFMSNDKLEELFATEEQYNEQEEALYKKLFEAKESHNKTAVKELKGEIKAMKKKFTALNRAIRDEQNSHLSFNRSAKPWLDAVRMMKQAENYSHFEEIKARYSEAKERVRAAEAAQ
ncbi:MAG: MFS transporter [Clostridia bacterium]